jgi:hypothetical protein
LGVATLAKQAIEPGKYFESTGCSLCDSVLQKVVELGVVFNVTFNLHNTIERASPSPFKCTLQLLLCAHWSMAYPEYLSYNMENLHLLMRVDVKNLQWKFSECPGILSQSHIFIISSSNLE